MSDRRWVGLAMLLPALAVTALLYLAPLVRLLARSLTDPVPGVENYAWLATSSATRSILATTLEISAVTAGLSAVLGFGLAYAIWLARPLAGTLMLGIVLMSFWLSVLVRCFALLMTFGPRGPFNTLLLGLGVTTEPIRLTRSEAGVLLGMVHYLVPYAVLTILASLHGIDRALIAAARSMGAGRARILVRVILPLAAPGILAALGLCFILGLGFYITPAIMGGGRVVMIAEFITFQVQSVLAWGRAGALSALLVAILAAGALAIALLRRLRAPSLA